MFPVNTILAWIINIYHEIRICFSIMDATKRFVVKSYVDASSDMDLDDSKSRSRYILKVGAIS